MFRNQKCPSLEQPCNLFQCFQNKDTDSNNNLQFSAEEVKNYTPQTEKRQKSTSA